MHSSAPSQSIAGGPSACCSVQVHRSRRGCRRLTVHLGVEAGHFRHQQSDTSEVSRRTVVARNSAAHPALAGPTGQRSRCWRPDEYSFYAKECYPTGQDRRVFFQSYVANAKPHTGYRLLPLLTKAGLVRSVWTTNFDGLVPRACAAANLICIEIGIDTPHRAERRSTRALPDTFPFIVFFCFERGMTKVRQ